MSNQPTNTDTRQETDSDAIATIIQRGHITKQTSEETAKAVLIYVNSILRPFHQFRSELYIDPIK